MGAPPRRRPPRPRGRRRIHAGGSGRRPRRRGVAVKVDHAAAALAHEATGRRVVSAKRLGGGMSNTMLRVLCDDGTTVVVRMPRRSKPWLPIEVEVMRRAGGVVPVPELLLVDVEGSIAGRPALVMRFVDGFPASQVMRKGSRQDALAVSRAVGHALGRLSGITFGHGGAFRDATLVPHAPASRDGLTRYAESFRRGTPGRPVDEPTRLAWDERAAREPVLEAFLASGRSLVHGDLGLANVLVGLRDGRWEVASLIDWELAFSGSPLLDLAAATRTRHDDRAHIAATQRGFEEGGGLLPDRWWDAMRVLDDAQIWELTGLAGPFLQATLGRGLRELVRRGHVG